MIWVLISCAVVLLAWLAVSAFAALPPVGRHRAAATAEPWAASLGEGWVLHMNGDAEFLPRGRRGRR